MICKLSGLPLDVCILHIVMRKLWLADQFIAHCALLLQPLNTQLFVSLHFAEIRLRCMAAILLHGSILSCVRCRPTHCNAGVMEAMASLR